MTTRKAQAAGQAVLDGMPLQVGDPIVWTRPDYTVVYCRITRVNATSVVLRCHHGGVSWTRHQTRPLYPSMLRRSWTTAELLDTFR